MKKIIIIALTVFALISSCAKKEEDPVPDTSAPTSPTISINSGESTTSSLNVTLTLSATDDVGVVAYYLSASSTTPSSSSTSWVDVTSAASYSATVSYTLTTTTSDYEYVYVWFKDAAGNVSNYNYDSIYYSPSPPTSPSITINGGASSTDNSSVTLSLSALDDVGVVGYYLSTTSSTPTATASGWTAVTSTDNYTDNVSYTLTGAAGTLNTVSAWFKDADASISSVDNDSIMYCSSGTTTMDEVEPNNTLATAMDLCPTSLITGGYDGSSVEDPYYYANDYFKVTASSNTMTVSLSHVSALASASDWDVYVYNSSETQIDSFDADDGVGNEIELWVTSGASYYIRVQAANSYTTFEYKLSTEFSTTSGSLELDTANDTLATAMTLEDNTTMRGERNGSSDYYDYYTIDAPSGKTSMNVVFTHDNAGASGSDNAITVYKVIAEGNAPEVQYFASNDGVDDNKTFGIEAESTYIILVDVNSSFGSSSGYTRYRYGLRASFGTEVYELEQNNTTATADNITAGTTYTGGYDGSSVEDPYYYANDYFKVTASSNTMTVSLSHVSALASASDWDVYVYNSSGTQIDSFDADDGVDNEIERWVTSGASYFIRVQAANSYTTYKYKLNIQFSTTSGSLELDTANDTLATAMTLEDNTTMRGERNGSSDYYDYYKITAPSGKTSMKVEFSHDNESASGSDNTIIIYKYIAEGNAPEVQNFASNDGVDDNKTFGIVAGYTYYIYVDVNSSFGSSSGYTRYRYGLRASFGTEVYELEQNNTTATAHSITAGTTYTGGYDGSSVEDPYYYANDYFAVTASSSTMTVSLTHVTASASASDWDVYVYNSSGTQIDSFDADNGVDASDNTSVTSGASYYIRVQAANSYTTYKYTLTASF